MHKLGGRLLNFMNIYIVIDCVSEQGTSKSCVNKITSAAAVAGWCIFNLRSNLCRVTIVACECDKQRHHTSCSWLSPMTTEDDKRAPADVSDNDDLGEDEEIDEKAKLLSREPSPVPSDKDEDEVEPRYQQPAPSPLKRFAVIIFMIFLFWLGFQLGSKVLPGKRKSQIVYASRCDLTSCAALCFLGWPSLTGTQRSTNSAQQQAQLLRKRWRMDVYGFVGRFLPRKSNLFRRKPLLGRRVEEQNASRSRENDVCSPDICIHPMSTHYLR